MTDDERALELFQDGATAYRGARRRPYKDYGDPPRTGDEHDLTADIPDAAYDLWQSKPDVREAYDTVDADAYDGRSGDLAERIEAAADQDAIVDLGSGTYEITSSVRTDPDEVVGVVGDDATIYYTGTHLSYLVDLDYVPSVVVEGVTFDISETTDSGFESDVGIVHCQVTDEFWAEDVLVRGTRHRWQDVDGDGDLEAVGGRFTWRVDAAAPDATGFNHRVELPDGGTDEAESVGTVGHAIGPNADPPHEGLNVWKDCRAEGFMDNGFYVNNSPGRNVLWNCTARNNAAGNVRIGQDDYVVGGLAEITDLPGDRLGQCLTHDGGGNATVVGLECRATFYGSEAIQVRSSAESLELDRVVLDVDHYRQPVRLSSSSGSDVQVSISDCYWYDGYGSSSGSPVVEIYGADVAADGDWRVLGESRAEIEVESSGSLTIAGEDVGTGTHTADELGLEDPRPLPEFYFDYDD